MGRERRRGCGIIAALRWSFQPTRELQEGRGGGRGGRVRVCVCVCAVCVCEGGERCRCWLNENNNTISTLSLALLSQADICGADKVPHHKAAAPSTSRFTSREEEKGKEQ